MNVQQCLTGIETPVGGFGKKKKESEVEKVKTFTQAALFNPKIYTQNTKKDKRDCKTQGNSVKHKETV